MLPHPPVRSGVRKERDFVTLYNRALRDCGWMVHKIADAGMGSKFLDQIFVSPKGDVFFGESKLIHGKTFNVSRYEPGQVITLSELHKRDPNRAFTLVYSDHPDVMDYRILRWDETWGARDARGSVKLF